jgi:hypothetical protein
MLSWPSWFSSPNKRRRYERMLKLGEKVACCEQAHGGTVSPQTGGWTGSQPDEGADEGEQPARGVT